MTTDEAIKYLDEMRPRVVHMNNDIIMLRGDALRMAISALEHQKWIPCSERMPKDNRPYLVCDAQGNVCVRAITSRIKGKASWSQDKYDVIAWKSLPKPYREEQN